MLTGVWVVETKICLPLSSCTNKEEEVRRKEKVLRGFATAPESSGLAPASWVWKPMEEVVVVMVLLLVPLILLLSSDTNDADDGNSNDGDCESEVGD